MKLLRQLFTYLVVYFIAGCSGGGCGGCAGGAIHPIHGEYPLTPENRIPHAMQIRLSQQGLQRVEGIAPALFGSFLTNGIAVPMTTTSGTPSITVCDRPPAGGCRIDVSLSTDPAHRGLELSFVAPDQINAKIRLILVDHNLPLHALGCNYHLDLDSHRGSYPYVGLETNFAIARDAHPPRLDYFAANLVSPTGSGSVVQETPGETIEGADISLSSDEPWWRVDCLIEAAIINAASGLIVNQVSGQIQQAVGPIQDQLAATAMPDPPGCPTGTTVSGTHCHYSDNALVPRLLGTEGTGNFGVLLGRLTPGLAANDSFVIGAGDHAHDAEVGNMGMTVDLFGALTSDAHSACVPRLTPPPLPTIPEWTNLRQNLVPGTTTTTDLGVGVAEEFMNSAMWNMWDSGMFCLGINTRMSQQLSAGIFTALPQLSGLKSVIFPGTTSAAALVLRPQQPPTITVGSGADLTMNPLLRIAFQHLAIDFYAFSEERYVRFMTVNTDLSIPMNLMTDATGLRPTLGMASTANTTVTNSQLLTNMPTSIAGVLDTLLGTAIGQFAGNIPAINLPSIPIPASGGGTAGTIHIQIPMSGIQGVTEGSSRYLALFANLQYMAGMMSTIQMDTAAQFEILPFDPHVYDFGPGFNQTQLPRVRLRLSVANSFGHPVEYTYRVDDLTWSPWTTSSTVEVQSPSFIAQGAHHIDVRGRIVDQAGTVDPEPARVDFAIDTQPPTLAVERRGDDLFVDARDNVAAGEHLRYNVAFDGQTHDYWTSDARVRIPVGASSYVVRVRDNSGNETQSTGELNTLTIRGGASTDASACGCSTPGARGNGAGSILAALAATLAALSLLRRRRSTPRLALARAPRANRVAPPPRILLWAMIPLFFVALGCNCGQSAMPDVTMPPHDSGTALTCGTGLRACAALNRCVPNSMTCDAVMCPRGQAAVGTAHFNAATCTWDTSPGPAACDCEPLPPLPQGMAGSHLNMAVAPDNTLWLSAYSAGDPRSQHLYGDLVVGTYDRTMNKVNWTHVDGVPADGAVTGDVNGWRGGISTPGDDVGRWNSIALDAMGHPRVAYWDTTHDQLKFASYDGTNWTVSVVDTNGHNGRYASLVLNANGIPAIAYRATAPDPMMAGHITARVRYAVASNATPHAVTDWTKTDAATAATSCRAADCAMGQVCLKTGVCAATGGTCATACAATQACVASACADIYPANWIEDYPPGIGLFNSLALDSMHRPQLVYYDRDRGNLMGTSLASGAMWAPPFIIDGEAPDHSDLGDRGLWASLALTPDDVWHVGYVDAYNEQVLYTTVTAGVPAMTPEVVDDGNGIGMTPFEDGHHIVGDSVSLAIDTMGNTRMVYQDSTAGTLHAATRGTMGWTVSSLDMMGSTGYWARIGRGNIATFWRDLQMNHFGVRVFQVR